MRARGAAGRRNDAQRAFSTPTTTSLHQAPRNHPSRSPGKFSLPFSLFEPENPHDDLYCHLVFVGNGAKPVPFPGSLPFDIPLPPVPHQPCWFPHPTSPGRGAVCPFAASPLVLECTSRCSGPPGSVPWRIGLSPSGPWRDIQPRPAPCPALAPVPPP